MRQGNIIIRQSRRERKRRRQRRQGLIITGVIMCFTCIFVSKSMIGKIQESEQLISNSNWTIEENIDSQNEKNNIRSVDNQVVNQSEDDIINTTPSDNNITNTELSEASIGNTISSDNTIANTTPSKDNIINTAPNENNVSKINQSQQESLPQEVEHQIIPIQPNDKGYQFHTVDDTYFNDALFIGDSRTVGLAEYARFNNADYFASLGMSVFQAFNIEVSEASIGKIKLEDLLRQNKYGKIYIMLGINEIGYNFDLVVAEYEKMINRIQELQPSAKIIIQANMHVGHKREQADPIYSVDRINNLNGRIKQIADTKHLPYIDVNPIFDDKTGRLDSKYTTDSVHVLGKYYKVWADWLKTKAV